MTNDQEQSIAGCFRSTLGFLVEISKCVQRIEDSVRALKPAPEVPSLRDPDFYSKLECVRVQSEARGDNLRRAQDEIERLQTKVADQALTIATLKDENAAIRKSIGDGDYGPTAAELQRFRDREAHVLSALELAEQDAVEGTRLRLAIAAVRDFKVTT